MHISQWLVYTTAEVLFVLLLASGLLFFHAKGLRQLIRSLQSRLSKALGELKQVKKIQSEQSQTLPSSSYQDHIDEELKKTIAYHAEILPGVELNYDLLDKATPLHQAVLFRHLFLSVEQAIAAPPADIDWKGLATAYKRLNSYPKAKTTIAIDKETAIEIQPITEQSLSYEEQRAEIERFKRLFTTMESQWNSAKEQAGNYYQQLLRAIGDSDDPQHRELLELAEQQTGTIERVAAKVTSSAPNLEDLRAINKQQLSEIAKLQQQLVEAGSDEQRLELLGGLEKQLGQQQRLMKESDQCISLLENELVTAQSTIEKLKQRVPASSEGIQMSTLLNDKLALSKKIKQLESENEQLASLAEHTETELRKALKLKDTELAAMAQQRQGAAKQ